MIATQMIEIDVDPLVVLAEAPGAVLEVVALPEPEDDREDERDVEPDHRDRRADQISGGVVPVRRDHQRPGEDADRETALYGTRVRLTLRHDWWPGTARSRENANIIREADVTRCREAEHLRDDSR